VSLEVQLPAQYDLSWGKLVRHSLFVGICIEEHDTCDDQVFDNDKWEDFWLDIRLGGAAPFFSVSDLALNHGDMLILGACVNIDDSRELVSDLLKFTIHQAGLDTETGTVV
jgi:hypothetical protein